MLLGFDKKLAKGHTPQIVLFTIKFKRQKLSMKPHSQDPTFIKIKDTVINLAKHNQVFYGWRISQIDSRSIQDLFLCNNKLQLHSYQNRDVQEKIYNIDVYTRSQNPVVMGNSSYILDPNISFEDQINRAISNALQATNKPWDLPQPETEKSKQVITFDPQIKENINAAHQKLIGQASTKVATIKEVKVNSAELYTKMQTTFFETSTGIIGEEEQSDIYFEIALEKLPLPNTQEVLQSKTAIGIEDADLPGFIDEVVSETLYLDKAALPKTNNNATVMINAKYIAKIVNTLISQIHASNEYNKTPFLPVGSKIYNGDKNSSSDHLKVTLDPTLPVMTASCAFTPEGLIPKRAVVIDNDVVCEQIVTNRMAQYLNKKRNPIAGNMVVALGSKSKEELLESMPECIDVISFSSLRADTFTLTWSSEIKLAKLYRYGKLMGMIKGGVVSGSIKDNFTNFCFSNKEKRFNDISRYSYNSKGYVGPDAMLIKNGIKV